MKKASMAMMSSAAWVTIGATLICACIGFSASSSQNIPPLPPMPTVYESTVDMTYLNEVSIHIKSPQYNTADLYETQRCPPWIDVQPPSGIVASAGLDLVFRLLPDYLPNPEGTNTGQIILVSDGGYSVITVTVDRSAPRPIVKPEVRYVRVERYSEVGFAVLLILGFIFLLAVAAN